MAKVAKQLVIQGEEVYPKTIASGVDCGNGKSLSEVLDDLGWDEASLVELLKSHFLRKDRNDRTGYNLGVGGTLTVDSELRAGGGAIVVGDITQKDTWGNETARLTHNEAGESVLTVDRLNVMVRALFHELTVEKMSHVGGALVVSPASGKVTAVEGESNGLITVAIDLGDYDGVSGKFERDNLFAVGDFVRCQRFTGSGQKFWWRRVASITGNRLTLVGDNYVGRNVLTDVAEDSDLPEVGDEIVVMGNISDVDRQNVIVLESYGSGSPSVTQYSGVSTMSLVGRMVTRLSPQGNVIRGELRLEDGRSVEEAIDKSRVAEWELVLSTPVFYWTSSHEAAGIASIKARVFHGGNVVKGTGVVLSGDGVTVTSDYTTGEHTLSFALGQGEESADIEINAVVSRDDADDVVVTPRVLKIVRADGGVTNGIDGRDGKDAVVWELVPSADIIRRHWYYSGNGKFDRTYDPISIGIKIYRTVGDERKETTANVTLQRSLNGEAWALSGAHITPEPINAVVDYNKNLQTIDYRLIVGSSVVAQTRVTIIDVTLPAYFSGFVDFTQKTWEQQFKARYGEDLEAMSAWVQTASAIAGRVSVLEGKDYVTASDFAQYAESITLSVSQEQVGRWIKEALVKIGVNEDGSYITLSADKTRVSDDFVVKRLLTGDSGARIEIEGTQMKVYGSNGVANIVFGTDEAGNAVLRYLDANGDVVSVFDQRGITVRSVTSESVTMERNYYRANGTAFSDFAEMREAIFGEHSGKDGTGNLRGSHIAEQTWLYTACRLNGEVIAGSVINDAATALNCDGCRFMSFANNSLGDPMDGVWFMAGAAQPYMDFVAPNDGQEGYENYEHIYPDMHWERGVCWRVAVWFDGGKIMKLAKVYFYAS